MTVQQSVQTAVERLRAAGVDETLAQLDARLLAREVLGWDVAAWLIRQHEPATDAFLAAFEPLVQRRAGREPVDRILGRREFWGLEFEISPAVLSPRADTELLVDIALALFPATPPAQLLDAGTGSGCLAVALARAFPPSRVIALDASPQALEVAARNAVRHGVADRITFRHGTFADDGLPATDLIVSNPPYIPTADIASLEPEVRVCDPREALDGGADGLDAYRALLDASRAGLVSGGWLVVEMGLGQEPQLRALVGERPWLEVTDVRADLQGIPRAMTLHRTRT